MASAADARRKLAAVKAKARAAGRRATLRKATAKRVAVKSAPAPPPAPAKPPLDPTRGFVSLAGEQRLERLVAAEPSPAPESPSTPPVPVRPTTLPWPPLVERRFMASEAQGIRLSKVHWTWTLFAYAGCLGLATQSALALPATASNADAWGSFGLWSFFVVAGASVLLLSWRNIALPAIIAMIGVFLLAWRGPFLAMGIFSDAQNWTNHAVPWWSLLTITFITKALETRGRRRRYHLRSLMVLQGMQIATYAGLILLSIFFLGRTGSISAEWAITIVTLVAAWFIQGRSLLVMWNRTLGTPKPAQVSAPAPAWSSSYEHTGK